MVDPMKFESSEEFFDHYSDIFSLEGVILPPNPLDIYGFVDAVGYLDMVHNVFPGRYLVYSTSYYGSYYFVSPYFFEATFSACKKGEEDIAEMKFIIHGSNHSLDRDRSFELFIKSACPYALYTQIVNFDDLGDLSRGGWSYVRYKAGICVRVS